MLSTGMVKTEVLKGMGIKLDKGEIGVILGPSGSGKSTLILFAAVGVR